MRTAAVGLSARQNKAILVVAMQSALSAWKGVCQMSEIVTDLSTLDMGGKFLRPYQIELIQKVRAEIAKGNRSVIICSATGCHAAGQGILMADMSIKRVEDVVVGDRLMGMPGKGARKVLQLCRGAGRIYEIRPVKGNSFTANIDHVLTLVRVNDGKKPHLNGMLVDVTLRDYLNWNITQKHIHKLLRVKAQGEQDTPGDSVLLSPYFLGVLLGDGGLSLSKRISVSKPDIEILRECQNQADLFGCEIRIESDGGRCPTYWFKGKGGGRNGVLECARQLGIVGIKSHQRFVPEQYKRLSETCRLELLAGLLDTDGSFSGGGFDFISKSERLSNDVAFLARSVGLAAYVSACEKYCQTGAGGTYFRVSISGDCSIVPCKIPRKIASKRSQIKDVSRTGFSVIDTGRDEDYYGFTLDGDGRYLLDDFTVTHNSGKTITASALLKLCAAKGKYGMFLAPRRELLKQTCGALEDAGVRHSIVAAGFDYMPGGDVLVASKDTLAARTIRRDRMEIPVLDMVVIDEAHGAVSHENRKLLEKLRDANPKLITVGLSATPGRADGKGLGDIFDSIVTAATYEQLRNCGFLVPCRVFAPDAPNMKGVRSVDWDSEAARRLDKPKLVGDVIEHWLVHAHDRQTVVFGASIAHSIHLRDEFVAHGIKAEHIDQSTPSEERDGTLKDLKDGRIQVVTNCNLLSIGWDEPSVSCVVLVSPSRSIVQYRQRAGRALRPAPNKETCLILDHAGAVFSHGFPDEDIDWPLEKSRNVDQEYQKKRKEGGTKEPMICQNCHCAFSGRPDCPNCGHRHARKGRSIAIEKGLLKEVSRDKKEIKRTYTLEDKQKCWHRCLATMARKGMTPGNAARMYKGATGELPWETSGLANVPKKKSQWHAQVSDVYPQYVRELVQ